MFSVIRYSRDSLKALISFAIVSLVWAASLVLPHFQPNHSIPFLFLSTCLFTVLFLSMQRIPFQNGRISFFHLSILAIIFTIEIALLLLACFNIAQPYLLFSRLGSYSMFANGQLMLFGDLRHLTSVVNCPVDVRVGLDICDTWGRHFNQNPDVGKFFRLIAFSDAEILGVITTSIFFFVILLSLRIFKPTFNLTITIFFTPPVMLAIDRGNEIITISLILLAMLINDERGSSNLTLAFLTLASLFKFWPLILLISWVLFSRAFSSKKKFSILFVTFSYVMFHLNDLQQIAQETQQGDSNGGSFGMGLINLATVYGWVSIVLILLGAILLFKVTSEDDKVFNTFLRSNPLFVSLIFTYLGLFLTGIHFNYRLTILLPIAMLLWKYSQNTNLVVFILALMVTSRLNIVNVTSCILFIYFAFVFSRYLLGLILEVFN